MKGKGLKMSEKASKEDLYVCGSIVNTIDSIYNLLLEIDNQTSKLEDSEIRSIFKSMNLQSFKYGGRMKKHMQKVYGLKIKI